ncbi:MAG: hypothetical protein K5660_03035, partial [Paludibacteraceae bacterium]|nr:hypothetical protein [Paludibacteraceae bacterium]
MVCFVKSQGVTYGSYFFPPKGNYSVNWQEGAGRIACYQTTNNYSWVYDSQRWYSMWYNSGGTQFKYYSGDFTFGEGEDGIYVTSTNLALANSGYSQIMATNVSLTLGTAPTYYTVNVNSNNNSYGTVTSNYKSGYVYANNRSQEYKKNSVYTISATPKPGYRFVSWSDGGAQTHDITITGNTTYTANFEPEGGTQYTITVQADNDDYCTVSGGGTYYEGEEITISSVSKNEHLYIFDQFMLEGEDEDQGEPSFEIEVTGNATYTAYYRLANAGTISATAAHGTVSGTGSYAGGTAVSLGVTADDG